MQNIGRAFLNRKILKRGKKNPESINRRFTGKETQMANVHMKICLFSFLVREMQNKILGLHIVPTVG